MIEKLNWRYATKKFDATKKISEKDFAEVLEAFRLSSSSYWLQPWKVIVVKNPETRALLQPHSWNQSQITEASHLLVFARLNDLSTTLADKMIDQTIKIREVEKEKLAWYEAMLKQMLSWMNKEQAIIWADLQVYFAVWGLVNILPSMWIDACPIAGFDPKKYDEILWLEKLWLSSVLVLPIWYRAEDDKYAQHKKVRYDMEDILVEM